MSGLVLINSDIQKATKYTKTVTVLRNDFFNMGVRIWYQILTTDMEMFQRWSLLMDPTDEVLLLTKPGDVLDLEYIKDVAEDLVSCTFEPFNRVVITKATFRDITNS